MQVFVLTSGMRCDSEAAVLFLFAMLCLRPYSAKKKKRERVFFMGIIQFLLSVGLKGVPVPGLLISRGLQLGPALISCNYKRIPVVTQSYSRLKELAVQRNAGTASESHRTQFAHVWSVYLTKNFISIQCG